MFKYIEYIEEMKKQKRGLMSKKQYQVVAKEMAKTVPCNLLVFGLGHDSYLWNLLNEGGKTIFLEDDEDWIKEISDDSLEVFTVNYTTLVRDWKSINFDESKLRLDLPEEVTSEEWDFIIVDAPLGHSPPRPFKGPGRMSTIYNGYKLLKDNGICVVDDMGREVERKYAYHYFGKDNLIKIINGKVGVFRK